MTDPADDPGPGAPDDERPDAEDPGRGDRQSPLAGFMSVPVHPRFPLRRSTVLMAVAFAGFATLLYLYPPETTAVTHTTVPPVAPTTTTTTAPPTTTTPSFTVDHPAQHHLDLRAGLG